MSIIERGDFGSGQTADDGTGLAEVSTGGSRLSQWIGALCMIFIVAALFGLVAFHATIAEAQTDLDTLEEQVEEQRVERDRLRLAVASLESPSRVVETAKGRLGMQEPLEITYLTPPVDQLTHEEIRHAFLGRTHRDAEADEEEARVLDQ